MKNSLNLPIADIVLQLIFDDDLYFKKFYHECYSISDKNRPSFTIHLKKINSANYNFRFKMNHSNKSATFFYKDGAYSFSQIYFIITSLIENYTLKKNIMFLHGSSFINEKKAYIFCGRSGVGKSTVINKVNPNDVLSDDTAIIKKNNEAFFSYTSPFDKKKFPNLKFQKAPVKKIFFLKQGTYTKFDKLSHLESLNALFYNSMYLKFLSIQVEKQKKRKINNLKNKMHKFDIENLQKSVKNLYHLSTDLSTKIPFYKLSFTKEVEFLSSL